MYNKLENNFRSIGNLFKGKVIPVLLTAHHAMKTYWESGGIAPRTL
jgi:hypothetical protein